MALSHESYHTRQTEVAKFNVSFRVKKEVLSIPGNVNKDKGYVTYIYSRQV